MKLRTIALAAMIVGFTSFYAQAQDGGFGPIYTDHYMNDCQVYVSSWFEDEYGGPGFEEEGVHSQISVGLMYDSFLYEIMVVATYHFANDFTGTVTFRQEVFAESYRDPNVIKDENKTFDRTGSWTEGQEVTVKLGSYYKSSGAWDGVPGHFQGAIIDVTAETWAAGYLRIDMVRVKRYPGEYCSSQH